MTDTIINLLAAYPAFLWIFTVIATVVAVTTILDKPVTWLVKVTPWDWDDKAIAKTKSNTILNLLYKIGVQLARFSLLKNK